jgi:isopenicillin N synthase-like dioxygenase
MRWTNDRWISNMHRVINPRRDIAASAKRLSIAFFSRPQLRRRHRLHRSTGQAKYLAVHSGEYRDLKYRETRIAAASDVGRQ